MNPFFGRDLRFSDAIYSSNITPKQLRNWLQRDQVELSSKDTDGWRTFSLKDVIILALTARLTVWGVPVSVANESVNQFLGAEPVAKLFTSALATQHPKYLADLFSRHLLVITHAGEWRWRTEKRDSESLSEGTSREYLIIDVEKIVRETVDRALEMQAAEK